MNDPMSIAVCLPDGVELFDPDPVETAKRDVRLCSHWESDTAGVVGWSEGAWAALSLAATHQDLPRLAIASLPFPEELPVGIDLGAVTSKTLLLYGTADSLTGNWHGTQWQKLLPHARLEMVPGAGHDLLTTKWGRILSHLAPRRKAC